MSSPLKNARFLHLTLYVADSEPNSNTAQQNLREVCSEEQADQCHIEIVDVYKDFERALTERIIVTPTLIVSREGSDSKIVFFGSLQDKSTLIKYLQMRSENE